jgi:hypothetical protein
MAKFDLKVLVSREKKGKIKEFEEGKKFLAKLEAE